MVLENFLWKQGIDFFEKVCYTVRMSTNTEKLKIIAVGNGSPSGEAMPIYRKGVEMIGSESPSKVLLVPTAKDFPNAYNKTVAQSEEAIVKNMGQKLEILHSFGQMPEYHELEEKIMGASAVYICGGDTERMMEAWRQHGIDKLLGQRALDGMVVMGVSAGAIAPMVWGPSNSRSYRVNYSTHMKHTRADGLGLLPFAIAPHYNELDPGGRSRAKEFKRLLSRGEYDPDVTNFGIDSMAALTFADGELGALTARKGSGVYNVLRDPKGYFQTEAVAAKYIETT
jgi:peptidase E